MQLLYQVHLEGAAYAAVLQCNQAVIIHTDHATLLYKACVDVNLAYVIYYYSKLDTLAVAEDSVQKGCLTAAQITGEQQDRCFFSHIASKDIIKGHIKTVFTVSFIKRYAKGYRWDEIVIYDSLQAQAGAHVYLVGFVQQ